MNGKIVAGLELGAREFVVAAGRLQDHQRLVVEAAHSTPACGVRRGVLSEPVECADAISRLARQAQRSLSAKIPSVWVALPGNHLKSYNAAASVPVPGGGSAISRRDVERVLEACRTHHVEYDRQMIHAFNRGFSLDGQGGIKDPVGLFGNKLTVELHLVTALALTVQNLVRVLNRAGLEVEGLVLPGVAVAEAVLADLDRDLGVTFIQIGDHQTEIVLFSDGMLRETYLLPSGMEELAESMSRSLNLPRMAADHLLEQVQSLEEQSQRPQLSFRIQSGALSRSFPQGQVVELLSGKLRDFIGRLRRRLVTSPSFLDSAAGVVMVGHFTRWEGFLEMAEGMLNLPVRLGTLRDLELSSGVSLRSSHLTAVGLLHHGIRRQSLPASSRSLPPWLRGIDRLRQIVHEYF